MRTALVDEATEKGVEGVKGVKEAAAPLGPLGFNSPNIAQRHALP